MTKVNSSNYSEFVGHHEKILWTRFATFFFGLWLIINPLSFDYFSRSLPMMINDIVAGSLVLLCSLFALSPTSKFFPYTLSVIGIWLNFAPLAFWAPEADMYLNDTLVGSLIIVLSVLVPSVPGEFLFKGPEIPPGWSYNPSSWPQRLPTMCLAVVSWFLARYMAAYQLGYTNEMWDPFFGDEGTVKVITSKLSRSFPISDAGFGAMAYGLEFLMGAKGGVRRWYTMPWLVICFGILVVPLGIVSILLVCCQPIIVHHWCTWCLIAATCCMFMITFTINEVIAVCQYIFSEHKQGRGYWDILLNGGEPAGAVKDERTPGFIDSRGKVFSCMRWGVTVPWNLIITAGYGIWLMVAPGVFGLTGAAADNDYIMGAITVVTSYVCMAEVVRAGRLLIVLFGIWEMISVWVLNYPPMSPVVWINFSIGFLMIVTCLPKGRVVEKYGAWDRYIF